MPEISQEQLDALLAAAAERDQLKAADAERAEQPAAAADEDAPPEPTHRATLANGETFDYSGAHPTHISLPGEREGEDRVVPVIGVTPLA